VNFGFFPFFLYFTWRSGFFLFIYLLLLSIYCVATVINQCGLTGNFLICWGPLLDLPFYYSLFLTKRKSSIKQSLAPAVTAQLFVKSIADPTLCQTDGVSVRWVSTGANSTSSARWWGRFFSPLSSLSAFCCFRFCFRGPSASGGVTSSAGLDGCVGCRDCLSLPEFSLIVFFFFPAPGSWIVSLLTAMPWFGGFIGNWFIGCVFFSLSREKWELLGEMGCGGGPWVLALLSTEALIFYYKEKQ